MLQRPLSLTNVMLSPVTAMFQRVHTRKFGTLDDWQHKSQPNRAST
jgi:hypothetical protein